jgi:putative oxidoreductase
MQSRKLALLEPLLGYTPFLALLVRVWFGWTLMIHGRPKLNKDRRAKSIENFRAKGVPPIAVILGTIIEFFGGLFLVIGLIVPVVASFTAIYFLSIIGMKKTKDHAEYVAFGKPNYELEAFLVLLSFVLIVLGAGPLSLDGLIGL